MTDEQALKLGAYIRSTRQAHGTTIRALAAQAGIDSGGLTRIEHGHAGMPRPDTLHSIAQALGVPLTDMFVLAGYIVPKDLPSVGPYLCAKYGCLDEEEARAITTIVERLAAVHGSNPARPRGSDRRPTASNDI
ncbi:MAG TPA: helix-turn-helix domain-containing protein [Pseudonocardiaceae bacterium]|jgi:transcriptional regulator with XRE-family HTH domain|nr:helix-turn-helix domain-containing protein [Pseudonocardiaceae bacterium]